MCYLRSSSIVALLACITLFTTVAKASLHERLHQLTMKFVSENVSDQESIMAIREKFSEAAGEVKECTISCPSLVY